MLHTRNTQVVLNTAVIGKPEQQASKASHCNSNQQ